MKLVKVYLSHNEVCELLDVPKESLLALESMHYDQRAGMWVLQMNVGTQTEIENLAEEI